MRLRRSSPGACNPRALIPGLHDRRQRLPAVCRRLGRQGALRCGLSSLRGSPGPGRSPERGRAAQGQARTGALSQASQADPGARIPGAHPLLRAGSFLFLHGGQTPTRASGELGRAARNHARDHQQRRARRGRSGADTGRDHPHPHPGIPAGHRRPVLGDALGSVPERHRARRGSGLGGCTGVLLGQASGALDADDRGFGSGTRLPRIAGRGARPSPREPLG